MVNIVSMGTAPRVSEIYTSRLLDFFTFYSCASSSDSRFVNTPKDHNSLRILTHDGSKGVVWCKDGSLGMPSVEINF